MDAASTVAAGSTARPRLLHFVGRGATFATCLMAVLLLGCERKPAAPPAGNAAAQPKTAQPAPSATRPGPAADPEPVPVREPVPTSSEPKELLSNDGTYRVIWRSRPVTIVPGEPFSLAIEVRRGDDGSAATAVELVVDGRMPYHGYGLQKIPPVEPLGGGRFAVPEIMLHMEGFWEIYFDLTAGGTTERAQLELVIEG